MIGWGASQPCLQAETVPLGDCRLGLVIGLNEFIAMETPFKLK
jgi:hypothetical protein